MRRYTSVRVLRQPCVEINTVQKIVSIQLSTWRSHSYHPPFYKRYICILFLLPCTHVNKKTFLGLYPVFCVFFVAPKVSAYDSTMVFIYRVPTSPVLMNLGCKYKQFKKQKKNTHCYSNFFYQASISFKLSFSNI